MEKKHTHQWEEKEIWEGEEREGGGGDVALERKRDTKEETTRRSDGDVGKQ